MTTPKTNDTHPFRPLRRAKRPVTRVMAWAFAMLVAVLVSGILSSQAHAETASKGQAVTASQNPAGTASQSHAQTAASDWQKTDFTELRLIAASDRTGTADTVQLGLQFRLKKGWKIYWRSPGDAGYPPSIDWAGSGNLNKADISWPLPSRFTVLGFQTLGYKSEIILPITATMTEPDKALDLKAVVDYLACDDICIPYRTKVALSLPAGDGSTSVHAHAINRYAAQVPGDGSAHGIRTDSVQFLPDSIRKTAKGLIDATLHISASADQPFSQPDVFVEGPDALIFSAPKFALSEGGKKAVLEVEVAGLEGLTGPLTGRKLTVTLADGLRSAETRLTVTEAAGDAGPIGDGPGPSLAIILVFALIGGLILNLMPCVLPVLSIKLLGAISHGGGNPKAVRLSFIASSAGILAAFMVLAGALIALQQSGAAIGWGIQFQQPWFLVLMTVIITLFACNLWGFFEFRLPAGVSNLGTRSSHVRGLGGHFMSGAFATLLATPCSAPFLGTAVGFALSRGPLEILAVFATLGVGLALPYLIVAAAPKLATRLPKPGRWMIVLRQFLGFILAVTGVWLLSVLAVQVSMQAAVIIGGLMVVGSVILFATHRGAIRHPRAGWSALAIIGVLAVAVPSVVQPSQPVDTSRIDSLWVPFDEAAIAPAIAQGKTVFVDVTADWCITCQVNKVLVLNKGDVFDRLSTDAVIAMKADWTRPNPVIAAYLAKFGRYGIPFNAVYGPKTPQGVALPELLTDGSVLSAIDAAQGPAAVSTR